MSKSEDRIDWVTIPQWHRVGFVGLSDATGLFRARLKGETMFLGHAAKGGLGPRLAAYKSRKGTGQNHHAGRLIYQHRVEITMQIAVMEVPADEIHRLLDEMLRERKPPWNVPNGHHRDL